METESLSIPLSSVLSNDHRRQGALQGYRKKLDELKKGESKLKESNKS